MQRVLLVRFGEIHLKGMNRPFFEKLLLRNLERALLDIPGATVEKWDGRYYIRDYRDEHTAIERVAKVFGVHSLSPAIEMDKNYELILSELAAMVRREGLQGRFKVRARRSDKRFPLDSVEIAKQAGAYLLEHVPGMMVDLHEPQHIIDIEIRPRAYLYCRTIPGPGGMPYGSNGRSMLLLSGGFDSPVAGWMVAKRGVEIEAIHYFSHPYTGEQAKRKVIDLCERLSLYCGPIRLHIVPFTRIQQEIYQRCPSSELTVIMRRYMMRIAELVAKHSKATSLITGESIGQVASQTTASLAVTDAVVGMPVFRPLIAFDKLEIMDKARRIGTFEISERPFEDCCTVFVPRHPVTRPIRAVIEASEGMLDQETLIQDAIAGIETLHVGEIRGERQI